MAVQPDLDRLQAILVNSGIQKTNNALFQVITQLIKAAKQLQDSLNADISVASGGLAALILLEFLTASDESVELPNSRQLLAGDNVAFDDTVANARTIDVTVTEREWSVMTDGDLIKPELIFAGGDVIMLHIP